MLKWLILFGGFYLIYRGLKTAFGSLFKPVSGVEKNKEVKPDQDRPYRDDDVIDVKYRDVRHDDEDDESEGERR